MKRAFSFLLFLLIFFQSFDVLASGCEGRPSKDVFIKYGYKMMLKQKDIIFKGHVEKIQKVEDKNNPDPISQRYVATLKVLENYKGLLSDKVEIRFNRLPTSLIQASYSEDETTIVIASHNSSIGGFVTDSCAASYIKNDYGDKIPDDFILYRKRILLLKKMIKEQKDKMAVLELLPLLEEYNDYTELENVYTKIIENNINPHEMEGYKAKRGKIRYILGQYVAAYEDLKDLDGYGSWLGPASGVDIAGYKIKLALKLGIQEKLNHRQYASKANLSNLDFSGLNWSNSELSYSDFQKSKLVNINLHNAVLHEADFKNADLTGADLSAADLRKANFYGARLDNVKLREAKFDDRTIWPYDFDPVAVGAHNVTVRKRKD